VDTAARHLAFHGAIVLTFGLLCGGPYARAINRDAPARVVQAWRLAHASLPMGATLMLAVSAVLSSFAVAGVVKWLVTLSLVVSSYSFCLSLPLAAVVGHRGLSFAGPAAARLVYAGNMIGAGASLVAAVALVYAGYLSL
jgi:hypothetical protein